MKEYLKKGLGMAAVIGGAWILSGIPQYSSRAYAKYASSRPMAIPVLEAEEGSLLTGYVSSSERVKDYSTLDSKLARQYPKISKELEESIRSLQDLLDSEAEEEEDEILMNMSKD